MESPKRISAPEITAKTPKTAQCTQNAPAGFLSEFEAAAGRCLLHPRPNWLGISALANDPGRHLSVTQLQEAALKPGNALYRRSPL